MFARDLLSNFTHKYHDSDDPQGRDAVVLLATALIEVAENARVQAGKPVFDEWAGDIDSLSDDEVAALTQGMVGLDHRPLPATTALKIAMKDRSGTIAIVNEMRRKAAKS